MTNPPRTEAPLGRILTALALGMLLAALDQTVIATSGPVIAKAVGAPSAPVWLITPYLFASLLMTPIFGRLSDTHGRRKMYLISITLFLIGSIAATVAPTLLALSISRGIQGLGAGGLFSLAFAIIADLVPTEERGRYLFLFIGVFGAASLLGPFVGGVFAQSDQILGIDGWRWIFLINIPLALLALAIAARDLHIDHPRTPRSLDLLGASVFTVAVASIVVFADTYYWWLALKALIVVGVLIAIECRRGADALIPITLLTNRHYNSLLVISFLGGAGFLGATIAVPVVLQNQMGFSPLLAGLMLLPSGFGNLITTGAAASAMRRNAEHHLRLLQGGIALQIAGFALLALWVRTESTPLAIAAMITIGAAFGLITQIGSIVAPNGLGPANIGTASGLNTFIRSLGQVLGTALIAGAILNGFRADTVFLIAAALTGAGFATIGRSTTRVNA